MARQPAKIDGDYVMVGEAEGEDLTIDDRASRDIDRDKGRDNDDDWDKPPGERKTERDKPGDDDRHTDTRERSGSLLGGRDPDDDKNRGDESGDDDGEEDARLAYEDPDDDVPQERGSRRQRRNRARRSAITARDVELENLRDRLARTEKLVSGTVGGQFMSAAREVDQRIAMARNAIQMASEEKGRAISEGKGDDFARLDSAHIEAVRELERLEQHKLRLEQQAESTFDEEGNLRVAQTQQGAPDPRLKAVADRLSSTFQRRFPWFKPDGNSRDDRIVREIDRELAAEGRFGTHDQNYWLEFEDRMQEAGYRPNAERPDARLRDRDEDETYEQERPERRPNRPPTGGVRPSRPGNERNSRGRLSELENGTLRQLGLLEEIGEPPIRLDEADTKRRDRIIGSWLEAKKKQQR